MQRGMQRGEECDCGIVRRGAVVRAVGAAAGAVRLAPRRLTTSFQSLGLPVERDIEPNALSCSGAGS